jgi:glycine cleavage system aminomethyltransferase T
MPRDEGFMRYLAKNPYNSFNYMTFAENESLGSVDPDLQSSMFNPFEIGLGGCINWNHEFRGKDALRKLKESEDKNIVTLRWNPEDLCKLYAMQFDPNAEHVRQLDLPFDNTQFLAGYPNFTTDLVYDGEGKEIGRSYGRVQSNYYHAILSFGAIARKNRVIGTEVYILRGEPGTHQIKIRATIERFPYNTNLVNDGFDVQTIPKH